MVEPAPNYLKFIGDMTRPTYFPWFDWLRAVCALTVMFYHAGIISWQYAGNFAVQVFFALSGWLIGGILLTLGSADLYRFYFNRAIRIWAPYFLTITLLLTISVLREPITEKWMEIVIYKITFVYNIFGTHQLAEFKYAMPQKGTLSHLWSVNAEEQFYLFAPFLLVWGANTYGRSTFTWVALGILSLAANFYPAIFLGVLAAVLRHNYGDFHLTSHGRTMCSVLLLLSIIGLFQDLLYDIIAPVAAIIIVAFMAVPGGQHRYGAVIGGMSYPLYLNHWIGFFAANFLLPNSRGSVLSLALSAIINIVFAIILYKYFEKRLLDSRARWFTMKRGRLATVVAFVTLIFGLIYGGLMQWK